MFDTIRLNIECPYCGEISRMAAQTRDLFCVRREYEVDDKLEEELDEISSVYAIAHCHSPICNGNEGFGKAFPLTINLLRGVVTSNYKILPEFY